MMTDDIVKRLAEELDSLKADPQVLSDAIDEIERLRAAGDALAEYLMRAWRSDAASDLVAAWKEACCG